MKVGLASFLGLLVAGCSGTIESGVSGPAGDAQGSPVGSDVGSATPGAGPGSAPTPGQPPGVQPPVGSDPALADCSVSPSAVDVRRLNRRELAYAVGDVFGVDADVLAAVLPRDGTLGGFPTVGAQLSAGTLFSEALVNEVLDLAPALADSGALPEACDQPGQQLQACVSQLAPLARRLLRHDPAVTLERLTELGTSVAAETDGRTGLQAVLSGLLLSPDFLFVHAQGESDAEQSRLATRLSLALWSSVPDNTLLDLAAAGALSNPGTLAAQVERMLDDPRFDRFLEHFASDWLTLDRLDNSAADHQAMGLDDAQWESLRDDMRAESLALVRHIFEQDLPISELLGARYTFVTPALARHYGLSEPAGDGLTRVQLPADSARRGLLTHAALLSQAASGTEASIVVRGEAVLAGFLCQPLPPPPPSLEEEIQQLLDSGADEREKMEFRASQPQCAGCHATLDPVGWSFTRFDPLGRPAADPPDTSGLFYGQPFESPGDLADLLVDTRRIEVCLTEKLFIHAGGRSFYHDGNADDRCAIQDAIQRGTAGTDATLRGILLGALTSPAFTGL